jgi:hypothetical protein
VPTAQDTMQQGNAMQQLYSFAKRDLRLRR